MVDSDANLTKVGQIPCKTTTECAATPTGPIILRSPPNWTRIECRSMHCGVFSAEVQVMHASSPVCRLPVRAPLSFVRSLQESRSTLDWFFRAASGLRSLYARCTHAPQTRQITADFTSQAPRRSLVAVTTEGFRPKRARLHRVQVIKRFQHKSDAPPTSRIQSWSFTTLVSLLSQLCSCATLPRMEWAHLGVEYR